MSSLFGTSFCSQRDLSLPNPDPQTSKTARVRQGPAWGHRDKNEPWVVYALRFQPLPVYDLLIPTCSLQTSEQSTPGLSSGLLDKQNHTNSKVPAPHTLYRSQHPKEQHQSCLQLIIKKGTLLKRETCRTRQSKGNTHSEQGSSVPGFDIGASWAVSEIGCSCNIS